MRVHELRKQLENLPDNMRVVTPDLLATRLIVENISGDIFVAIITDYDESGEAHQESLNADSDYRVTTDDVHRGERIYD